MSRLTFNRFQQIQEEWSDENIGEQSPDYVMVGLIEEMGNLSSTHIKKGTDEEEEADEEARKIIGDIVSSLSSYCSSRGWSLESCVEESWKKSSDRDWRDFPEKGEIDPVLVESPPYENSQKMTGSESSVPLPVLSKPSGKKWHGEGKKAPMPRRPLRSIAVLFPGEWYGDLPKPEQLAQKALDEINEAVSAAKKIAAEEEKKEKRGALSLVMTILDKAKDGTLVADSEEGCEE